MAFNCGCPSGYTFNPLTDLCEQIINPPTDHGSEIVTIPAICPQAENMVNGTAIYPTITSAQFPLTGSSSSATTFIDGLSATITPSSNILSGNLWISGGNVLNGLLNQRGIGLPFSSNTWYGVNRCVTVQQGDVISFAISAKVAYRLYIDGVLAVISQPNLPAQTNKNLHVFPIALSPGQHTFRAEGLANGQYSCGGSSAYGAFLCEVYLNVTPLILSGITSQGVLNSYYAPTNGSIPLLSQGGAFDVSSDPTAALYYCASGYVNACNSGGFSCTTVLTEPYVPCCFNLVECTTGDVIVTNTDLSSYIGHIIKIEEAEGCYLISNHSESIDCTGAIATTTTESFEDCETCAQIYYKLTDCNGVAAPVYTSTDLSQSVGTVIKIANYLEVCWIPTVSLLPLGVFSVIVSQTAEYSSCESCLYVAPPPPPDPPFYKLSPITLKSRAVQPGYGVGECSVDLVERINCNFASQMYVKFNEQKYGIESCYIDDFDKWWVKKQLLELNLIYNPDLCKTATCCKPECVLPTLEIFDIVSNTTPYSVSTTLEESDTPALPPQNPGAEITY